LKNPDFYDKLLQMRSFLNFLILIIFGSFLVFSLFLFFENNKLPDMKLALENQLKIPEILWLKIQSAFLGDAESQKPLANPPKIIKAIYSTNWSAGNKKKLSYLINLIKKTELNAIVIDIKDFSGYVGYQTEIELVNKYKAAQKRISKPNALIKYLHDNEIYVIGRISVFQDQALAKARPDLAIKNKNTGETWRDDKKLAWIDSASKEAWDYNIAIAQDALNRGFDEINFDYIRFASDGKLENIAYPIWDGKVTKKEVIRQFFEYLRQQLPEAKLSADLFGLTTINKHDMGIGQYLENAFPYFDFISPMVYPSHYAKGFMGYKNPADHPYKVVKYSMESALNRLIAYRKAQSVSTSTISDSQFAPNPKFRPWLQDFHLGSRYDAKKVRDQIQAVYDALGEDFSGFMLWNPANVYTTGALLSE
jgi:hypothetical protein